MLTAALAADVDRLFRLRKAGWSPPRGWTVAVSKDQSWEAAPKEAYALAVDRAMHGDHVPNLKAPFRGWCPPARMLTRRHVALLGLLDHDYVTAALRQADLVRAGNDGYLRDECARIAALPARRRAEAIADCTYGVRGWSCWATNGTPAAYVAQRVVDHASGRPVHWPLEPPPNTPAVARTHEYMAGLDLRLRDWQAARAVADRRKAEEDEAAASAAARLAEVAAMPHDDALALGAWT